MKPIELSHFKFYRTLSYPLKTIHRANDLEISPQYSTRQGAKIYVRNTTGAKLVTSSENFTTICSAVMLVCNPMQRIVLIHNTYITTAQS